MPELYIPLPLRLFKSEDTRNAAANYYASVYRAEHKDAIPEAIRLTNKYLNTRYDLDLTKYSVREYDALLDAQERAKRVQSEPITKEAPPGPPTHPPLFDTLDF